jgi:uncharacterized protein YbjT (DUF2867 family)
VLVVGAGGRFAPIAEALLARGHLVRVTSREPASPAARRLASLGAEIAPADYEEAGSLAAAAAGVDAVFASGTAHHSGPEGELRHGRNLVQAVAAAGVRQLVFVSGDGAAPDSPVPLFRAKWAVEDAIRAARVPHTILAPTYLMENLFNLWNLEPLRAGVLPSPVPVELPLQQTASADLLALAAIAVEVPARFVGRRIALASDEVSALDAVASISALIPRELEARQASVEELPPPLGLLFAWLESPGHRVDIAALHAEFPEVGWHSYRDWASEQLERFRDLCSHPEPVAG